MKTTLRIFRILFKLLLLSYVTVINLVLISISRKTKCSAFTKHFVPESHLLTQIKM